jgi:WG containing repeat/zinc-ribbon domain
MAFCIQCGNELPSNAKFCSNCGTKQPDSVENSIPTKFQDFENKLLVGSIKDGNSLKFGFVDRNSNWVIPAIFEYCEQFDGQGYSRVKYNGNHGCIDVKGNWIIQPIFDFFYEFDELGYAIVAVNEKYGFIDRKGNWAIQPIFDGCEKFDVKGFSIVKINHKYGCIDRKGNWVFQPILDRCYGFYENDFAVAVLNGNNGIIDRTGNWILQPIYYKCTTFDEKGYASVKLKDKSGFIDINGNWIIQPIYDECNEFDDHDFSQVFINDKFGFIDRKGNWIIQPIFDLCLDFRFGLASASLNGKYGFIDRTGNWVIQPIFDRCYYFSEDGFADASINEKCGVIDRNGNWVIQPIFDDVDIIDSNTFRVELNKQMGLIDSKCEWILEPIYHVIITHSDNILEPVLSYSKKYGYFSTLNNQWIISPIFDSFYGDNFDLDDYLDEIKSFFDDFDGKLYIEENIPQKKLNAILSTCHNDYDLEEIQEKSIVYFDDTVWGKGDNGFLIFHNDLDFYLIISEYGGASNYYKISNFNDDPDNLSSQIISVDFSKDGILINSINNETDENQEISYFRNDDITKALFDALNSIVDSNGTDEEEEDDDDDDDYLVENVGDGAGIR